MPIADRRHTGGSPFMLLVPSSAAQTFTSSPLRNLTRLTHIGKSANLGKFAFA